MKACSFFIFILFVLFIISFQLCDAKIIRVPGDSLTIQSAITGSAPFDTVLVWPGTYTGAGNINLSFNGKPLVVTSKNGPETTVIDCDSTARGLISQSWDNRNSIFSGFTILNGRSDYGGAIFCSDKSSPVISNCIIKQNYASLCGGGISCRTNSTPLIQNCTIINNTTVYLGGGIHCDSYANPEIVDCTISADSSEEGGGIYLLNSSPSIKGCMISDSRATKWGGGILCYGSSPIISDCIISENTSYTGGGLECTFNSSPVLENNLFSGNSSVDGGAIFCDNTSAPSINRCVFYDNVASSLGGAVKLNFYSAPFIVNCTFSENTATLGGGLYCSIHSDVNIWSSIFWSNYPDEISSYQSNPYVYYSDIMGGYQGNENINENPIFLDPINKNFRIHDSSPCVDMGLPEADIPLGGGCRVDMGAFEVDQGFNCIPMKQGESASLPPVKKTDLYQNYPNPFNPLTTIKYDLCQESEVSLKIYDLDARLVKILVNEKIAPGSYSVIWNGINENGKKVNSGIYIYTLITENRKQSKKMILIK